MNRFCVTLVETKVLILTVKVMCISNETFNDRRINMAGISNWSYRISYSRPLFARSHRNVIQHDAKSNSLPQNATYTIPPLSIQTKAFFNTGLRRDAELHCEQIRCHSVRTIKVLRMQPLDGEYDIIWQSYMSVKFAKRLNTNSESVSEKI